MDVKIVSTKDFNTLVRAAYKGGWTERATTVLDNDFNKTKCIHHDGGYVVVDDAYAITILHIDENGFVSEVREAE